MPIDNLIKLNLFYQALPLLSRQTFLQEIPNSSIEKIEKSFNYVYSQPLYNSCDNSQVGTLKIVGNYTTIDDQSKILLNVTNILYLENGSLTFSYNAIRDFKPDPETGTIFFPPSIEESLTFIYGTGDYYKANVKYSSVLTLGEDVNKNRFFEIIIQK
jgi:hypothetical protein